MGSSKENLLLVLAGVVRRLADPEERETIDILSQDILMERIQDAVSRCYGHKATGRSPEPS